MNLPSRIKIIAGGGPTGTRILDAETGEDLSGLITAVHWQHIAGEVPRAVVTYKPAAVEVEAEVVCRHCGRVQTPAGRGRHDGLVP